MPLVISRTQLNQGSSLSVAAAIWATGTGADIRIHTSLANNLPALAVGEFFEVRDHSVAVNNGLYVVVTVTTSTDDYECDKVSGAAPTVQGAETVTTLGATGASTEKSVFFDTAALGVYIMEQGNVDANGVIGQAIYSFMMQEWKDDDFLIANASFPMLAIDTDAGKYIIGQNAAGENTGWNWVDVPAESIRTRKVLRDMGWDEVDVNGVTLNRYFSATTLGTFEDPVNDNAFYQFGTDTISDDTVNFDFNGPVNEAVRFFERQADGAINGGTGIAIDLTGRLLTRSDGGNWRTDGYKIGGQITIRDAEDSTTDGTWLCVDVGTGVNGAITCGRAANANAGIQFADGGGGDDSLVLPTGETTFTEYGYVVGSKIIITSAEDVGNNGTHVITSISADGLTAFVATASFTANADDTTAVVGMFDDALTPDITINGAINNDNAVRLGLRVRDGDTNGKTFGEANLASAGKAELGNFVFAFPLANATDLKISETDANIDANVPYTGMSITFHSTAQVRSGLVGGSFNFGIIVNGNNGTAIEVFEWIQRQLRKLTDIDADADTAIGRAIGLLARFVGDNLEVGSGDGGLTVPVNPDGGGSGVYIDNLNAVDANNVSFMDNTGVFRVNPETIAVTLDFNQTAIDDTTTEFDLFYDRTIRTNVTDFVLGVAGGGQITSAGVNLPNNAELGVGSYVRVSGLTGGDAPMNGVYQITAETTPGADWTVVRYDGVTIVAVASTTVDIDQNVVDTPDAIIVDTNVSLTATTISFTATNTISDSGSGFGIFAVGDIIRVEGTASNNGIYEIATVVAGTITTVETTILTEGAGASMTITKIASGLANADFTFSYAFDDNVQGGRTVSTPTFFVGKAIGSSGSQYIASPVSNLISGTPLTIPLFAQQERNFA
jgi:hypothetical protein